MQKENIIFLVDADLPAIYDGSDATEFAELRDYFIDVATKKPFMLVDLFESISIVFQKDGKHFSFTNDAHPNGYAHTVVAYALLDALGTSTSNLNFYFLKPCRIECPWQTRSQ